MSPAPPLPTADRIEERLRESGRGPLKPKELARALDVEEPRYRDFKRLLETLVEEGRLYQVKGGRYAVPDKINLAVGRLTVIRSGDGFVNTPGDEDDVFVRSSDLESAMHGDRVVARIERRPRGKNPAGRVIKVLKRAHPTVVGTFHREPRFSHVVPMDAKLSRDVMIAPGDDGSASDGDVVLVEVTSFGDRKLNPVGAVTQVLGPITDPGVDVISILYGHGLPLDFPEGIEEAAERAGRKGMAEPGAERRDRTDLHVFTIDPADAKDHDDALSVTPAGDGHWEVGVHIADVSHFVEPGSVVDREAFERGTSVYLVDRVVPMLPHALSSHVCSLHEGEDRFAVSLFMELDEDGTLHDHRFERTRIRARRGLSYEEAQGVLDGEASVDEETDQSIWTLARLARGLRARRVERGSIDFDLPEARVVLGQEGEPVDIQRILRFEAHRLIEDFMLLANETVAREGERRELPYLYRVHEPPATDSVEKLREFLGSIGHQLPKGDIQPKTVQKVLERVKGEPSEGLVSRVVLRSMSKARYQPENLGHFGLAAEHYTHFTSPIRRYPDLVIHRIVVRALVLGQEIPRDWGGERMEEIAEHSSERELVATAAERDSIDLKKVEFMERHLGDEFSGTIAGVTAFGFFVLLDRYFVEGLVHVNTLDDDYYHFREEAYALEGERTGRRFRLADPVRVKVARVNKEERQIDFALLD